MHSLEPRSCYTGALTARRFVRQYVSLLAPYCAPLAAADFGSRGTSRSELLPESGSLVLLSERPVYSESGQEVRQSILKFGIDFGGGSARFRVERPRLNSRGFCFAPVRRVSPTSSRTVRRVRRGAVAQLGERCNRTAEVRGSIPLSSTGCIARKLKGCPPPLGRT